MPERVVHASEVSLNARRYKVKGGKVRITGPGAYPPKYIIGDYKGDSDPRLSVVHWNDLTGGWGIDRIKEEKRWRHARFAGGNPRHKNATTLQPLFATTADQSVAAD